MNLCQESNRQHDTGVLRLLCDVNQWSLTNSLLTGASLLGVQRLKDVLVCHLDLTRKGACWFADVQSFPNVAVNSLRADIVTTLPTAVFTGN